MCLKAPQELLNEPLFELVNYLVGRTKTELETVRVIYRWITAQDLSTLTGQVLTDEMDTGMDYLIAVKSDRITYHTLMETMCRLVNEVQ